MTSQRTAFAFLASLLIAAAAMAQPSDDEIVELDALALRAELAAGRLSAERVTQAFLRRIEALDDTGPALGAVIEVNPDALAIARLLDRRRGEAPLGALHGVPVLLKANIDTADRMATTAGSAALAAHRAAADAPIVTRLRAAGAVILAKTNLSEWANFRSLESTSGWSSLGGQTRNPYVLDRNPCGSSSGSAVAVAARFAPLAVGTETDGSIVCPAGVNGVVGIKPTTGSLPGAGIVPISPRQDTAGVFARSVADAALLLEVLGGAAAPVLNGSSAAASLRDIRIGVIRNYYGAGQVPEVEAVLADALGRLASDGATLVDPIRVPWQADVSRAELELLLTEFRESLNGYLATVRAGPRSLAELIAFNDEHSALMLPHFGQDLFLAAQSSGDAGEAPHAAALRVVENARATLGALFATHDLDVLVAPANGPAWVTDWAAGDAIGVSSARFAAISGHPSVVVPAALAGELPIGIAFIGKLNDEPTMLAVAEAFERSRGPFAPPRFLATLESNPR